MMMMSSTMPTPQRVVSVGFPFPTSDQPNQERRAHNKSMCVFHPAGAHDDESAQEGGPKIDTVVSQAKPAGADWGDQEEEEKDTGAASPAAEAAAAEDEDDEGEEEAEEEAPVKHVKAKTREPFEVPMQGNFWLHDDRFDEAEAAAHEE